MGKPKVLGKESEDNRIAKEFNAGNQELTHVWSNKAGLYHELAEELGNIIRMVWILKSQKMQN